MKVEIDANLELKITAENDLEVIALRAWSDEYFKRNKKNIKASLVVALYAVEKNKPLTLSGEMEQA